MKTFVTSDLHFNHANIIEYEKDIRKFESVEDMNNTLISNWNSVVSNEDVVYVLGDFVMGPLKHVPSILEQLNGTIILIRGNHDSTPKLEYYKSIGIEVHDIYYKQYRGRWFIMCHFPIASKEFIDMVIKDNSEVVVLYGHIHSNASRGYVNGTYHVGVDTNDLTPIDLDTIWEESWDRTSPEIEAYRKVHDNDFEGVL